MIISRGYLIGALLLGMGLIAGCAAPSSTISQVEDGNTVQVNYTGTLADGTVFDSSEGREPLEFTLGSGQLIPGFEKAVIGMKVGEKKTVTIPANEAYGPYRQELAVEVPLQNIRGIAPEIGMVLQQRQEDGSVVEAIITKITESTVTLDANLPLAGQDLTFEIELLKIIN